MKTPEEMAEEYVAHNRSYPYDSLNAQDRYMRNSYLVGYQAGHAAGFESAMKIQEAVTEHLEKQLVEEMYVRIEPLLKEDK